MDTKPYVGRKGRAVLASVCVVALLMLSSVSIIMSADSEAGQGTSDVPDGYIGISGPDDLKRIGSDPNYPRDGKYYQTNDITFSDDDRLDGFWVTLEATNSGSGLEMTISAGDVAMSDVILCIDGTTKYYSNDPMWPVTVGELGERHLIIIAGSISGGEYSGMRFTCSFNIDGPGTLSKWSSGNFKPIGTSASTFTGTYEGNGKKIIGMETAVYNIENETYSGMFGKTDRAEISGIVLEGGSNLAASSLDDSSSYAGGIAGRSADGVISGCVNSNQVIAVNYKDSARSYAGGICGFLSSSSISDSENKGDVYSTISGTTGIARSGGIAGILNPADIYRCNNSGNIFALSVTQEGIGEGDQTLSYAGGIFGHNISGPEEELTRTEGCSNSGSVTSLARSSGDSDVYSYSGGISGRIGSSVEVINCTNYGPAVSTAISGDKDCHAYAGGIVGYGDGTNGHIGIQINSCSNFGEVRAMSEALGIGNSLSSSGGMMGLTLRSVIYIQLCINHGSIEAESVSNSISRAGGMIGYAGYTFKIRASYNDGNVTAAGDGVYAGGLVGQYEDDYDYGSGRGVNLTRVSAIGDCYNRGDVLGSGTLNVRIGGIIGSSTYTRLVNCYSTGNIAPSAPEDLTVEKGGIIGAFIGACEIWNCYFLYGTADSICSTTDGLMIDMGEDDPARTSVQESGAKSSEVMKRMSTYYQGLTDGEELSISGWGFQEIWFIDEGHDYPIFDPLDSSYTINVRYNEGGDVSPRGGTTVQGGGSVRVTFQPYSGYVVADVLVDGRSDAGAIANGYVQFSNVREDHSVEIMFSTTPMYNVTVTAGKGGNAYGTGNYEEGSVITISATASKGYSFSSWSDGSRSPIRTVTVAGDMIFSATFTEATGAGDDDLLAIIVAICATAAGCLLILVYWIAWKRDKDEEKRQ